MITSIEPQVLANGRYNCTETAQALGIHINTLTRYTKQGFIKYGNRRESLRKFYLGSEIKRFWNAHL